MIAIIRIRGLINVAKDVEETLYRLKLRRKYSCIIAREKPELKSILKKIRNFVAYGKIDEAMLIELIKKRGKPIKKDMKIDAEKIVKEFIESKIEKKLRDLGIKDFFGLHPPRGGFKNGTKKHYPKGVLGDNKQEIGKLIRRML